MNHNDHDDEINQLLQPLRNLEPNHLQIQRWQNALKKELTLDRGVTAMTRRKWLLQLAAAMFAGAVLGALLTKILVQPAMSPNSFLAQNSADDATFEHSHTNLD